MTDPFRPILMIPARMASTRLPGKPLADIHGSPMIAHVLERAREAGLGPVVVACAEAEIAAAVRGAGGHAVLTTPDHPSGSDRVFEALSLVDAAARHDVVINVQGDLPTLDPAVLRRTLDALAAHPDCDLATPVVPIRDPEERTNPNAVKAVVGFPGGATSAPALYFSRAAVPWGDGDLYHHVGLYAWRREALARFVGLPPGVLERRERLEQLRALENGMRIAAARVDTLPLGVDTPADLERARTLLARR